MRGAIKFTPLLFPGSDNQIGFEKLENSSLMSVGGHMTINKMPTDGDNILRSCMYFRERVLVCRSKKTGFLFLVIARNTLF